MEKRHVAYFLAVVEAGSITEAARRLHLSQPSVSEAIKELEREMRTPLFERGRRLTLTAAGEAMVGPARRALRAFESVKESVRQVDGLTQGVLDLAVAPQLGVDPTIALVTSFRQRYPGVQVQLHETEADVTGFESLRRGQAELLIHEHPGNYPKHVTIPLRATPMSVAFPPGTEEIADGPVRLDDLIRYPFILGIAEVSTVRAAFVAELAKRDLPPLQFSVLTEHRDAIVPLVIAGLGATMLTAAEAHAAEQLGCIVRQLDFEIVRTCSLFYRKGHLSPAAHAFATMAAEDALSREDATRKAVSTDTPA